MPYFATQPSPGIATSVRNLVATLGGGSASANDLMAADAAGLKAGHTLAQNAHLAAQTQHQTSLAEKVRAEVEAMRKASADRENPVLATEYAARAAGMDLPVATQLEKSISGVRERPAVEVDDEGERMPDVTYARPAGVSRLQEAAYNASRAALMGNRLATGKTTGDQLAKAGGEYQEQGVTRAVQEAIARGDVQGASAMNQGGKLGTAIKLFDNVGSTGATFAPATGAVLADPNSNPLIGHTLKEIMAKIAKEDAQAGASKASAANSYAHAAKTRADMELAAKGTYDSTRGILVDPRGGTARDVLGADGKPIGARERHDKPPQGYAWGPNNAAGQPTLVKIEGGPVDVGKQLPHAAVKDLGAAGAAVEDTARLAGSFKKGYGGKTVLGDLSNTFKRIAGDDSGQAQWWQDMDALQNQTRHALFGSALTATELKAWEKTSIQPRMDPQEIQKNLIRRQEIEARAASKLARSYAAANYNKEQINELLGVAAQYINDAADPVKQVNAIKNRFKADAAMKGKKLGVLLPDGRHEVLDASGKVVGYYD